MIEEITVDGFKSLKDFKITFNEGINVLVGPNGSGKTNICQAITLLSAIANEELTETFTSYGGIRSTFDSVSKAEKPLIRINSIGKSEGSIRKKDDKYEISFNYTIELTYDEELEIKNEILLIGRKSKSGRYKRILTVNHKDGKVKGKINDKDLIGHFNLFKKDQRTFELESEHGSESFIPIISRLFYAGFLVFREFSKIKSFNIDPNIARQSCDLTEPKEMMGNGKYLANALYSLSKSHSELEDINSLLEQIITNHKEVKPSISETSFKRYFSLIDEQENVYDSNSLSDGTIKLIGLLAGIATQKEKTTIIEEPENYLHPFANKLLIAYLRETFKEGICLITSHSETILNQVKPSELIICKLKDCYTESFRIHGLKNVEELIRSTGFGCGYHYIAGNLGGMP